MDNAALIDLLRDARSSEEDCAEAVTAFVGLINRRGNWPHKMPALVAAVRSYRLQAIRAFGARGDVDPNKWDVDGVSPLEFAIATSGLLRVFLEAFPRVYVDRRGYADCTALHMVAASEDDDDNVACAELLVAHGANPEATDDSGRTPATVAAETGNHRVLQVLHRHADWHRGARRAWLQACVVARFLAGDDAKVARTEQKVASLMLTCVLGDAARICIAPEEACLRYCVCAEYAAVVAWFL